MTEVIGVRFKSGGKQYYFNPNGVHVDVGEHVIIETAKGVEFAECVQSNFMVDEMELVSTLRPMLRVATKEDFLQVERNKEREKNAYKICQKKILEHGLEMKLVDVKYSFDGSKILFYFTADGRVDFRSLVKDLASVFRTRIELRQIGVRDEARMMGGLGVCGRPFCCSQFLEDFQPVSIKMAKTQSISLSPTKISGSCGRLMCCLKYEQEAYEDLLKKAPKLESLVKTPDGVGVINQVNLLREQCQVVLDKDPDEVHIYKNNDIEVIRSGKGKRPAGYEKPEKPEKPALQPRFQKESASAPEQKQPAEPPRKKKASPPRKNSSRPAPAKQGEEEKRPSGGQSRRRHRPHHRRGGETQQ
ncbi:MAG: stage 0 sporulation protein [Clostridiales bacterium]|nr:stage 0 sporulation protein [Clostridiales bacterium]